MEEKKIDHYHQMRAKEFVDALFNKDYFRKDVSRDDMNAIEDFLAFLFQSLSESTKKLAELDKRAKQAGVV